MSTPQVSIIMPTHNRANYITEAIESIQKQTYQNWELIIVDDGSEDNTEAIISTLSDCRICYYKEGRIGMEKTRNKGLEKAKGDLIGFMDSDDLWVATKLEKQVKAFENYPEASFCLAGGYEFREAGVPLVYFYKQKEGVKFGDLFVPFFKSEVAATMPTLLFRKECLQVTGNFSEKKPVSHISFILSLARHFKGIVLYEPLFSRRLHNSNYSSINAVKRHLEGLEMIRLHKGFLPPGLYTDALFRSHLNFGGKYLEYKKEGKAIHQFLKAWKYKPLTIVPLKKIGKAILQFLKQ
jgi:glycosyltransferase involved in cell wall biosynthesis